jgi:hypothetical protein
LAELCRPQTDALRLGLENSLQERTITPNNRLVGAIDVSQKRMGSTECPVVANPHVRKFAGAGKSCITEHQIADPYGYDPSFMSFSSIYNGKIRAETFYNASEIREGFPYGFYPHEYSVEGFDPNNDGIVSPTESQASRGLSTVKASALILDKQRRDFKLYFDERLTFQQASKMLTFARNGSFIDRSTKDVTVTFVTYNTPFDIFCSCEVIFRWAEGGKISWDYHISSLAIREISLVTHVLSLVIAACLIFNTCLEGQEVYWSCRKFNMMQYLTDFFNWIDWCHIILMWFTVWSYYRQWKLVDDFEMQSHYPILFYGPQYADATANNATSVTKPAQARMFRTKPESEYAFLIFLDTIKEIDKTNKEYRTFSGIALVIFLFRVLKSLDFQERMGLVTRTLNAAASDLIHFIMVVVCVCVCVCVRVCVYI